ncbi:MAG: hypothetical protein HUU35_05230, partial [Armatimonadetes bacterium]|nr:hypothetical protein [Armatimonadota bacterium]
SAALKYTMLAPAGDHRRAWSPAMPVKPGQRYEIAARVYRTEPAEGNHGLYVAWYPTAEAVGEANIQAVRGASNTLGVWEPLSGRITVPDGAAAMRVLFWAAREAKGTFFVDDVSVTPVAPPATPAG